MFSQAITVAVFLVSLASAHFSIEYPESRGDSFATGASQYIYPCANVNQTAKTNRTTWPLTGGSLNLDLHHPWSYIFVNLGLGTDYPTFNISLINPFLNETGNGTLCLPEVTLPAGISPADGTNASIQVVAVGETGSALYNCADIVFKNDTETLSADKCSNSTGVSVSVVAQEVNGSTPSTSTSSAAASSSTRASAASAVGSSPVIVAGVVAGLGALLMSWFL
ncbi:Uncharacterized protein LHYA1_G007028 [Lachnellula hyalina]|uniref:Copper acquisition factor BIM1-like domain-containing protein n=1 Tax=Lachnellula hyalina TaxID=1316788 RepID=A0A8H8QY93_9HELO|nr:Uncharacterized protein LHYA1_G007028 [Lachnellula hyalina]TVY24246.1 Uncharacterized protein LHYA1_G007028 [Lachnellula hyalina]